MRYHANARLSEGSWLPAGAWSAAVGSPTFEDGEPIWIGCDVGGTEAATAVVWMNAAGHVGAWIETAEDAILNAVQMVRELAGTYRIEEFCYDVALPTGCLDTGIGGGAMRRFPTDGRENVSRVGRSALSNH